MTDKDFLKDIDKKIQLLKKTAMEINTIADNIPAVEKNSSRILASIKMLEINISDYF